MLRKPWSLLLPARSALTFSTPVSFLPPSSLLIPLEISLQALHLLQPLTILQYHPLTSLLGDDDLFCFQKKSKPSGGKALPLLTSTSPLLVGPILTSPFLLFTSRHLSSPSLLSLSPTFSSENPAVSAFPLLLPQFTNTPVLNKKSPLILYPFFSPLLFLPFTPQPCFLEAHGYTYTCYGHLLTLVSPTRPCPPAPTESLIPGNSSRPARSSTFGGSSADFPQVSSAMPPAMDGQSPPEALLYPGSQLLNGPLFSYMNATCPNLNSLSYPPALPFS